MLARTSPSVRITVPCLTRGLVKDWRIHLMANRTYLTRHMGLLRNRSWITHGANAPMARV